LAAAAVVLTLAAIPFALALLRILRHGRFAGLDGRVANKLYGFAYGSSRAKRLVQLVTDLGHWSVLGTVVVGVTGTLLIVRRYRDALFLVTTVVAGVVVDVVLKGVVERARSAFVAPVATDLNKSFPSGHVMNSVLVYGALLVIVLPELRPVARAAAIAAAVVLVVSIGASRVALAQHYISDVVGGATFGVAWLAATVWAFTAWRRDRAADAIEPVGPNELF
jgi:undecaprenyl-diphosphatase